MKRQPGISADLKGKRAIVTGGASGIGLSTVELFAEMGATVAMNDVPDNPRAGKEIQRLCRLGYDVFSAPGDLRDGEQARSMVRAAAERMGGLDYLINNAGHPVTKKIMPSSDLDSQTEEFWQEVLSINLVSCFRTAHAAAPYLKESNGAIVNTGSMSGWRSGGSSSPYCVAKGGIITLTKELARGLAPNVRVNAISPSFVADSNFPLEWDTLEEDVKPLPLKRAGKPREYAEVSLFLCAGAGYMTGETVHVDGGFNA